MGVCMCACLGLGAGKCGQVWGYMGKGGQTWVAQDGSD